MQEPLFDWSTVHFIAKGESAWTQAEAIAFMQYVEELYRQRDIPRFPFPRRVT